MLLDLAIQEDLKKAELYFKTMVISNFKIELKRILPNRSISLNSYLHVCISLFSIEFGYNLEESKTLLKRKCSFMIYEKNGLKFLKKTSTLNNKECSEFVEFIRNYAAQQNLYIPDAEEYKTNKFNIDKEINKNKEYL
tara:strand:+ start:199 stop:612 length:414 start_codon:yes stop_codon:yes gene_type:complete